MSTANRLLNVLALFTMERPQWTVEEAAADLGLTISTAYRYFKSLVEAGLLSADTPGNYTLGPAIIQYDRQMRLHDPLIASAAPIMHHLATDLGNGVWVLLCRLFRTKVMCVHLESIEGPEYVLDQVRRPVSYGRGQPMPLHRGAPSKAILAHMNFRTVRPIYDSDPGAFGEVGLGDDWDAVKRNLRQLRREGAIVTRGELPGGMQGIALPVFNQQEMVIGSLSVVVPRDRKAELARTMAASLQAAVADIQASLASAYRAEA